MAKFGSSRKSDTNENGPVVSVRGRREPGMGLARAWSDPFEGFFSRLAQPFFGVGETVTGFRTPRVDLRDTGKVYEVDVELPGVARDDIEVNVVDGRLEVRAQDTEERTRDEGNYHYREIGTRSFYRTIRLPPDADEDDVEASVEDGCLCIEIGKTGERTTRGRRIDVK